MKIRIKMTYKTKKGIVSAFELDEMEAKQELAVANDLLQTGRVSVIEFIDELNRTWSIKRMTTCFKDIETEPLHIRLYFDGGFDRDHRLAGLGVVIYYEHHKKKSRLRKNACIELKG